MFEFVKKWFVKPTVYISGPNTLKELLTQFDVPKKEKSSDEINQHFCIQVAMYQLELDYLEDQPSKTYIGSQAWNDENGNKNLVRIPCIIRPDVLYCSYGKN